MIFYSHSVGIFLLDWLILFLNGIHYFVISKRTRAIWQRNYFACHECAQAIMNKPKAIQKVCEKRRKFMQLNNSFMIAQFFCLSLDKTVLPLHKLIIAVEGLTIYNNEGV